MIIPKGKKYILEANMKNLMGLLLVLMFSSLVNAYEVENEPRLMVEACLNSQ
jgi:hypothetical protein